MSIVKKLYDKGLIVPPEHVKNSISYLCYIGSAAYGVSDSTSDLDCYGWSIPYRNMVLPHETGYIDGFGDRSSEKFEQWQQHHIYDEDDKREYDITIYNIIKYFQLCMDNNPNMIDSLFVPQRCILSMDPIGQIVRENRHIFLHLGSWHKFKGYAYSQMSKMREKHYAAKKLFEFEEAHGLDPLEVKDHKELMIAIEIYANKHGDLLLFIDNSKTKRFAIFKSLIDQTENDDPFGAIKEWFTQNEGRKVSFNDTEVEHSFVNIYDLKFESHSELTKKGKLKQYIAKVFPQGNDIFDKYYDSFKYVFDKLSKSELYEYHNLLAQFGFYSTKRMERVRKKGMDTKFAYHIIRLVGEIEQIMREGDLTLDRKDRREHMKAVRNGEWSFEQIADWFDAREKELQTLYNNCKVIPYSPRYDEIHGLLRRCLEMKFGDLSKSIGNTKSIDLLISKMEGVISEFKTTA
jgi:predicted nucleotidyltransferase